MRSIIEIIFIVSLLSFTRVHLTLALTPDQLLDILNLKESEATPPPPPKDNPAIALGQLLRKFLEDNFRQLYYELFVINATVSNMKHLPKMNKDINKIKEVIPQINAIQDGLSSFKEASEQISETGNNLGFIKEAISKIEEITKANSDINVLRNLSRGIENLRENYFADSKQHAASLVKLVQMTFSTAMRIADIHQMTVRKRSCNDLLKKGERRTGIHPIWPDNPEEDPIYVYCDNDYDGGGWTVIQRRGQHNLTKAERQNFNKNWTEYEMGFGNASQDYWLGLENMRSLTRNCPHELLINLTDWEEENRFAHYEKFHVGSKLEFYKLFVEGHSGNVEDSFLYHNKKQFSTFDKDNDEKWTDDGGEHGSSCSKIYGGGWWFGDCLKSNLNGVYPDDDSNGRVEKLSGLRWNSWTSMKYSLKMTEMKIRPIRNDC